MIKVIVNLKKCKRNSSLQVTCLQVIALSQETMRLNGKLFDSLGKQITVHIYAFAMNKHFSSRGLAYSRLCCCLPLTVSVNRLGLEVILKYIQYSSKCSVSLPMFTCLYTSGTRLVQSTFTIQYGYRASPSLFLVMSW